MRCLAALSNVRFPRLVGALALMAACESGTADGTQDDVVDDTTDGTGDLPAFTDHEGTTFTIRGGIAYELDIDGESYSGIRLTNAVNPCDALTWHLRRDNDLSRMFRRDPFDEASFEEAIANTAVAWEEEIGEPQLLEFIVELESLPLDTPVTFPSDETAGRFWGAIVRVGGPFEYESYETESGFGRTFGPSGGYEAGSETGTLELTRTASGVSGSADLGMVTDELAQFDFAADFDVAYCTAWADAWAAGQD